MLVSPHQITEEIPLSHKSRLAHYKHHGGYTFLNNCRRRLLQPQAVINHIEQNSICGLGENGFSLPESWATLLSRPGPRLLLIEIDQEAARTSKANDILQTESHHFLDGMLIVAWALAVSRIWICLHDKSEAERGRLDGDLRALQESGLIRYAGEEMDELDDGLSSEDVVRLRRPIIVLCRSSGTRSDLDGLNPLRRRGQYATSLPKTARRLSKLPTLRHDVETLRWICNVVDDAALAV